MAVFTDIADSAIAVGMVIVGIATVTVMGGAVAS